MKTNYKTNIIALAILLMGTITTAFAQDEQSNTYDHPDNNVITSSSANVLTFNYDKSYHRNENFYVVYGRKKANMGKWMEDVKFEVQREGLAGTRDGMFADWHHLRLVANWDNSKDPANIIFGFDSNIKKQLREEMTLTDDGRLIVGRHQHNSNTYNPKAFNLVATYDNGRKSYTNDRLQVHGNIRLGGSKKLGSGRIKNWGVMEFLADDDKSNDRIYKFYGYEDREKNEGESEYITFDAKKNKNIINGENFINGETTFINDIRLKKGLIKDWGVMKFLADDDESGDRVYKFNGYEDRKASKGVADYITFNAKEKENVIRGNTTFEDATILKGKTEFSNTAEFGNTAEFSKTTLFKDKIGVGIAKPHERLHVLGKVKANSFVTDASSFPDYVFENNYTLMPLKKLEGYIKTNKHLPGMPTETEVVKKGLDLKKVTTITVEKLEELYLYTIQQQKLINKLSKEIDELKKTRK